MRGRWMFVGVLLLGSLASMAGCSPSVRSLAVDAANREWQCPDSQITIVSEAARPEDAESHREYLVSGCGNTGTILCDYKSWVVGTVPYAQWFCAKGKPSTPPAS
jgi:hypothetical protein